jgi:cadmium resistance protein CadD (predicted permease)
MLRGFTVDILVAIMLFYILNQIQNNSARKSILIFTFIGFIGFLTISYLNFIWYETPDIYACMMDGIIPWAVLGAIGFKMRIKNQSNPL